MALRSWRLPVLTLSGALLCINPLRAADAPKVKEVASFGVLRATTPEAAKAQALTWYLATGGTDKARFEAIWSADRPLMEKVANTLALGNKNADELLTRVRDENKAAPEGVPALVKDKKVDPYLRANLGLAYASILAKRRVFEDAQLTLNAIRAEDVVDPSLYFFIKSVTDFSLMSKDDANVALSRLLEDVEDAPDRYKSVGTLMYLDMLTWQDNDLDWISRKMKVIADRLDINRGGDKTKKMQKEVLVRLDEMIKEKENKKKQEGQGQGQGPPENGGACPPGGPPMDGPPGDTVNPSSPQNDSIGGSGSGKGEIDAKEKAKVTQDWGTLPEKQRAKAMQDLTRKLPREMKESVDLFMKTRSELEETKRRDEAKRSGESNGGK